jgi:hypothetical protein
MKTTRLILLLVLLMGCQSSFKRLTFKKELISIGGRNEYIENAILDFSNTSRLYRMDTVFSVKTGDVNKEILVVRIGKNNMKLLITKNTKIGTKGELPSIYIEKNGKLFFWWDDDYPLTEKTLEIFHKYNLLQDDEGGIIKIPDFVNDDGKKAAHYYFCKNDLTKYKKIITNKGIGYYKPPKLNCDCKSPLLIGN